MLQSVVWDPNMKKKKHENTDKVNREALRWVKSLKDLSFEEILEKPKLPTLGEEKEVM